MILRLILFILLCTFSAPVHADEGAGLIVSDLNGALPKALWRDQPRSEITYLLKNLPANAPLRALQVIKRNMLISTYDTSLIDDDVEIKNGEDLLTLRLQKLLEMGLWEDAFTLYTKTTEDAGENSALAQVGVLLILLQKGLPTACLEEKVFSSRFPDAPFWQEMDKICAIELGAKDIPTFAESAVLQAVFHDKGFNIPASDITALEKLTPLELAVLANQKKIGYQQVDLTGNIAPIVVKTFLQDPRFPEGQKGALTRLAIRKALLPEPPLSEEEVNQAETATNMEQKPLLSLIARRLVLGESITSEHTQRLKDLATENPQNYVFIQLLNDIKAVQSLTHIDETQFQQGLETLSPKHVQKAKYLKSLLDKPAEFSNNPAEVYEKQISLTPDGHYVMPTGSPIDWFYKTKEHQFVGLSLLIILSNIETIAEVKGVENHSTGKTLNVLRSLSAVGLINQTYQVAREELAILIRE